MKTNKKDFNYLDYVPRKNELNSYSINEQGNGVVRVANVGFYNKIAQVIFRKPKFSNIELEEYGTFIWEYIDGKNTIYDIALKVKGKFGENAEPLYDRICQYFSIMADNRLVFLDKKTMKK